MNTRSDPQIDLEEFVDGEVIVRVGATPVNAADGPELADQVAEALEYVHTPAHAG